MQMLRTSLLILTLLLVFETSAFAQQKRVPPTISVTDSAYGKGLEEFAALFGLGNLATGFFNTEEFEIRVWVGFDNTYPLTRGLVLAKRKGIQTATFITGKFDADRKPEIEKDVNPKDSSGIKTFGEDFDIRKLITGKYKPDAGWGDPDATGVIVELRRGEIYKRVSYQINTGSVAGKKILEYVRNLEKLYGVKLIYS